MKSRNISVAALLTILPFALPAAEVLLSNVIVLSPERLQPLKNQFVLIRDERIVAIGAREPQHARDAQRINCAKKFLTPGIMDSHVHVSEAPGVPYGDPQTRDLSEAFFRQQPRSYLYFGVTQVLDPSNIPAGIAAFQAQPQKPDLFRCGPAPVLNGYPTVFIEAPLRYQVLPDYIVEPANRDALPAGAKLSEHTPEAVVDRIAKSGAKCIKLFIEDGFGPRSDWPILSIASIRKVRELAHTRGLLVMAHANALDMQHIALEGGVDILAHGLWNWTNVSDTGGAIPKTIAAHLHRVHDAQVGWQPTLRVMAGLHDLFTPETLDDPQYSKAVPAALLDWYRTDAGQWYKQSLRKDYNNASDELIAKMQWDVEELGMRATRYLSDLGHPLLLASDTPSSPTYGNQPGYDTYREMRLLAQAGIPLQGIFAAATLNNARQFGIDKDYGTVQVGKIANLLLLDANPLLSIDAWDRIDKIILHGRPFERKEFAANAPSR